MDIHTLRTIAIGAGLVAQLLTALIALVTNIAFYHTVALTLRSPGEAHAGAWVIVIPVVGALIIGAMARYGSAAIRGHDIPEVMERVLYGESRIPARVMVLKPLSAAVAIGTGAWSGSSPAPTSCRRTPTGSTRGNGRPAR